MKILRLELTAMEPLVITDGSAESMAHNCLDYVPGNMLLGAFAKVWLRNNRGANPDASPAFRRLFLGGDLSWGRAVPELNGAACLPVPQCFFREKRAGGLPVHGTGVECDVYNKLAASADSDDSLQELYRREHGITDTDQKMKFRKLNDKFMSADAFCKPDLRKVWNTRVALGRKRSALEGQLFGFSALAKGTRLLAEIYCGSDAAKADLEALLPKAKHLHVGHARSSGYGRVAMAWKWLPEPAVAEQAGPLLNVYLLSPYLPAPAWEAPLENLLAQLGAAAGGKAQLEKAFISHMHVDAFNSHWQRPRDSRHGLDAGGVIQIRLPEGGKLPQALELGGENLEGFGRMLVNPAFLEKPVLYARAGLAEARKESLPVPDLNNPVIKLLRERALERLARQQALAWLHDPRWQKFVETASKPPVPSASQRSAALRMKLEDFVAMLEKSAGEQWKKAVCLDPFSLNKNGGGQRNNHLSDIMKDLLEPQKFLAVFNADDVLLLPGGNAGKNELDKYHKQAHAAFLRELGRSWGKTARGGQSGK